VIKAVSGSQQCRRWHIRLSWDSLPQTLQASNIGTDLDRLRGQNDRKRRRLVSDESKGVESGEEIRLMVGTELKI
jgi:hypothetical protein